MRAATEKPEGAVAMPREFSAPQPFESALMAQGDGTHRLPVKADLRHAIGKEAGDTVQVRLEERIG